MKGSSQQERNHLSTIFNLLCIFFVSILIPVLVQFGPDLWNLLNRLPDGLAAKGTLLLVTILLWTTYRDRRRKMLQQINLQNIISGINPDALLVVDRDRNITMCNKSVEQMFGYDVTELLHQKTDILYADRRARPGEGRDVYEKLEEVGFHTGFATGKRRDGRTIPLEIITGALVGEDGAVLLIRDITARKHEEESLQRKSTMLEYLIKARTAELEKANQRLNMEIDERRLAENEVRKLNEELEGKVRAGTEELRKANRELEDSNRRKDDFLSTVSHELRTPLSSIRSFSEILLSYDDIDHVGAQEFLEIINSESARLSRLINDLLDLSKIEAGMMVWHDEFLNLEEVIRDAERSNQPLLQHKGLKFRMDVSADVPPIVADRDRMQQVMTNLLGNAVKFSPQGGEIVIRVEAYREERQGASVHWVRVAVSDNGMGIEKEDLGRIFEKFKQSEALTSDMSKKGTGLGLAICREIIGHYGGDMWVDSERGAGSTFFFSLPAPSGPDRRSGKSDLKSDGDTDSPRASETSYTC